MVRTSSHMRARQSRKHHKDRKANIAAKRPVSERTGWLARNRSGSAVRASGVQPSVNAGARLAIGMGLAAIMAGSAGYTDTVSDTQS